MTVDELFATLADIRAAGGGTLPVVSKVSVTREFFDEETGETARDTQSEFEEVAACESRFLDVSGKGKRKVVLA